MCCPAKKVLRIARGQVFLLVATAIVCTYIICNRTAIFHECMGKDWYSNERVSLDYEYNDKPLQVLLVSTWRSGSSFTGQLLASIPDSMYYFEPIRHLRNYLFRIQGPPMSSEASTLLHNLLNCDNSLLSATELHPAFFPKFNSNITLLGEEARFHQILCRKSPFHVIKLVRLHLNLVESVLEDHLQLRVLYLVRDPRGTLNSRWEAGILKREANIATLLCMDLVSEFYAAKRLQERFPDRFKVVRYEDLAENVSGVTEEILRFLGLEMHPRVVQFIDKHTHVYQNGPFNLNRSSSYTATRWTKDLSSDRIVEIQNDAICRKALQLWGYKMMSDISLQPGEVPYFKRPEYNFEEFIKLRT